ncbi:EAL domain-containing protein [Halomonas sp. E14]|uniref:EAL domain-containing protein n=2 Tax=unclassified Halomonas TaxID=2609666 RepID=UPI00403E3CEF
MLRCFDRLSLEARFFLAFALPLVVIAWMTTFGALERQKVVVNMRELQSLTRVAVQAGGLVHHLQIERGMGVGFIGSRGANFAETLPAAREATDAQAQRFLVHLQRFDLPHLETHHRQQDAIRQLSLPDEAPGTFHEVSGRYLTTLRGLSDIAEQLRELAPMRQRIDALAIGHREATDYYTQINLQLHALVIQLAHLSHQSEIQRQLVAYHALMMLKELAGLERAAVSHILASGEFSNEMHRYLLRLAGQQEAYHTTFQRLADSPVAAHLSTTLESSNLLQLTTFRDALLARANDAESPGADLPANLALPTPEQWFAWKSRHIEAIKEVEDGLATAIIAKAQALQESARFDLFRYLTLSPLAVAIALLLAYLIIRQLHARLQMAATIFNHTHDGITVTDSEANILELNQAFSDITGYSRDEVLGQNPRLLQSGHQSKTFYKTLWQQLLTSGTWQGEIWNRRKNGEVYAELLSISAVYDKRGQTQNYVAVFSDITERVSEHQRQLKHSAYHDPLTGLPNRMLLADRLEHALNLSRRNQQSVVVAALDLDNFKALNERHGHAVGDQVLKILAKRFRLSLREGDTLARLGGDEFTVVIEGLESSEQVALIMQRLQQEACAPLHVGGTTLLCSASMGATRFPEDAGDADILLRHASQALHLAKLNGRNRLQWFDPQQDRHQSELSQLVSRLEAALADSELQLHYQPKVDMVSGALVGAEALLRWHDPKRGLVPPGDFLPAIEHHPVSVTIGQWVIETALAQIKAWRDQGADIRVSVNIGALQLQQPDFIARLRTSLAAYPELPPEALELEILESAAIGDIRRAGTVIAECRALGVGVSLDDFGTGYAALEYLKYLPAERLKIDRTFIGDMLVDGGDLAIVKGIIALADAFGYQVIAEGVENEAQGARLIELGCRQAQGFGIGRPMPSDAMLAWYQEWQPYPSWQAADA